MGFLKCILNTCGEYKKGLYYPVELKSNLAIVKGKLNPLLKDLIKALFRDLDDDGNGTVEWGEFSVLSDQETPLHKIFDEADDDKNGKLDEAEFVTAYQELLSTDIPLKDVEKQSV